MTELEGRHHRHGHGGEIRNVAVSLSGGGVRAVGFHLGMLEMLDQLDLLKKVTVLSSVSGGSLTGTGYALSQQVGQSFDTFFRNFYDFLPNLNTVEELMAGLARKQFPSPSGRRDLITVLANVYDDYYTKYFPELSSGDKSPRFNALFEAGHPDAHLREIVFNATEFQTGAGFRFQKSEYRCLIGNANIYLCERHARMIRMADIMASSSCIPAGMEPLFFPHDFHWPDDTADPENDRPTCEVIKKSLSDNLSRKFRLFEDRKVDFFALMDGGVYDNQGIVSLLLALNRQAGKEPKVEVDGCVCGKSFYEDREPPGPQDWARWFAGKSVQGSDDLQEVLKPREEHGVDLIVISDTPVLKDSQYPKISQSVTGIEPIPAQQPTRKRGVLSGLTVGGLDRIAWGITILLMISAGVTFYQEIWPGKRYLTQSFATMIDDILLVIIPLVVVIALAAILTVVRKSLRNVARKIYGVLPPDRWRGKDPWHYIRKLRIRDLVDMLVLRAGSVSALTASIFMNRIRSLSYSAAYSRDDTEQHILPNQIFELESIRGMSREELPDGIGEAIAPLSDAASAIVSLAAHMPTKLWINEIDDAVEAETSNPLALAKKSVVALNQKRRKHAKTPLNDFDVLVISGQLTVCYNLMMHLWNSHRRNGEWLDEHAAILFEKAAGLWNSVVDEPCALLDNRKRRAQMS